MSRILLVEDDPILGRGLVVKLELEGYQLTWMKTIRTATQAVSESKFDLIVLDLGLPDGSGLKLCDTLRKDGFREPIIILTAQTDENSVVEGLTVGATDYIRKPFGQRELLARIKNCLKEPLQKDVQLRYGEISISRDQRRVTAGEKPIELNRREFDILSFLVEHAESVVTRENLLNALDKEGEIFDRTIDSHLSHLRSKLKQAEVLSIQISSVYGVGYRLEKK